MSASSMFDNGNRRIVIELANISFVDLTKFHQNIVLMAEEIVRLRRELDELKAQLKQPEQNMGG